jgi:hypothetical protein
MISQSQLRQTTQVLPLFAFSYSFSSTSSKNKMKDLMANKVEDHPRGRLRRRRWDTERRRRREWRLLLRTKPSARQWGGGVRPDGAILAE